MIFIIKRYAWKIAETFNRTDADLVYAKGKYVDKEDISKIKRLYPSKDYKPKYLNFGWIPLHTTIYVKKRFLKNLDYIILDTP